MEDNKEKNYYTTAEAMAILKVNHGTIYRYLKSGKLTSFKLGAKHYITKESIDNYFNKAQLDNRYSITTQALNLTEDERKIYFNSGVFNDYLELYLKKFIEEKNINYDSSMIHEDLKEILDNYSLDDLLEK